MPARTLPTFTQAEVDSHNTSESLYVTVGRNVYDLTDFLESHPGGPDYILDYAAKDVGDILKDEDSHVHSDSAYEVLEESLVGFLVKEKLATSPETQNAGDKQINEKVNPLMHPRTGMSCEEDLSKDTDLTADYKTHKFLDLNKPLLMQSDAVVGCTYGLAPPVLYGTYISREGLNGWDSVAAYWCLGLFLWTLVEYILHRFLFHLDHYLPDNRAGLTLHFLLHGVHHYLPMDKYRLVMPPTLFAALATPFYKLAHAVFYWNWHVATAVFCGGIFGYICYDCTHYFLHHQNLPYYYKQLKKHHLAHHFLDYENGFGVSSRIWDKVFGTEIPMSVKTT
ncbi:inositolphosphorylceramide-B C-26 hydroxylase [Apiospora saccharicola]|uniref:Ceramide very long chain fatty acid hydroxylase n=1 Tax=Apiospora saccharicola TaxID=335842 RepID=A0ABR1W2R6_9PEZI